MYTHNGKVSIRQVKLLLMLQMFNMNMLVVPRVAAKNAGHDGYLLPLLGLGFGIIYVLVITKLLETFPGEGLDRIAPKVVGKFLGVCLLILYIVKLLIGAGIELRLFAEMISEVLLPSTPLSVIILLLLCAVYYLIKSGIEATGRMAEIIAYFVFVPLVLVLALVLIKPDYGQLLPLFQAKTQGVINGAYHMSMTFLPLELMLIIGALVNKPSKVKHLCLYVIGVITVIEIIIIAFTFMGVGMVTSSKQIWPVLTLMQSIQLPGTFFENQEILMMSWWVLSIYMNICGSLYVASLTMSRMLDFNRQNVTALPLIPIIFVVALIPGSLGEGYAFLNYFIHYTGLSFLFVVPLLLLVIAKIRKVGGKHA